MSQVHGECARALQAKQNFRPQGHSGSQYCSPSTCRQRMVHVSWGCRSSGSPVWSHAEGRLLWSTTPRSCGWETA